MSTASRGPERHLRILVLTSTLPRWVGDSEPRFVLDLCRHLSRSADVMVLAPHTPGAAVEEVLEGVRVRRFHYFVPRWQAVTYSGGITARLQENLWRAFQLPFFFAALWWQVRRQIRVWSPDVIHAHWIIPQALVACIAVPRSIPILCTSHGGDLHGLRGTVFRRLKAWTLRHCRSIAVVSESMVPHVRALIGDRAVAVIPMGTDLRTRFTPPSGAAERDGNHIVCVGRLVEKKGVPYLLKAFAALKDDQRELRLTIAGDGPLKGELQDEATRLGIAERVSFIGSVRHSELPALYQRATLAVFPFVVAADGDQEGFGLVVVEAMGCGCPVIASDVPAVRESIEPAVTGILTPPKDVDALADAIRACLADGALRRRLAEEALARVRERFDWRFVAERYRSAMDNLLTDG